MRFNEAWFNRHLENMGQDVLWHRSYACACVEIHDGNCDPKCKLCRGKGKIYDPGRDAVCAPAGQKAQAEWAKLGMYASGDIVITIPASSVMWELCGQSDRITLKNATEKFSTVLVRGGAGEKLLFQPPEIDRVFWRSRDGLSIVEGTLPVVDALGNLTWGDGAPPPGTTYSMTGRRYCEYHLFDEFPSNRNMHRGARLPKRVVIRKYDLAAR